MIGSLAVMEKEPRRQESRPVVDAPCGPPKASGKRADCRCKGITIARACPNSGNREIRRGECRCLASGPVIVLSLLTTDTAHGRGEAVDVVDRRGGQTLLNFENTRTRARSSVTSSAVSECLSFSPILSSSVVGGGVLGDRLSRTAR